jgi:hypothetical protein
MKGEGGVLHMRNNAADGLFCGEVRPRKDQTQLKYVQALEALMLSLIGWLPCVAPIALPIS